MKLIKMMKLRYLVAGLLISLAFPFQAQSQEITEAKAPENWFNLDYAAHGVYGVSTEKTYQTLLKEKTGKKVVVAVIDSGVDNMHEDLKDVMWVNTDEIAGNGIDDDKNGYIDDVHGWNFIGGPEGKNIQFETLELTRLVAKYRKMFSDRTVSSLSGKEKKEYDRWQNLEKDLEERAGELQQQAFFVNIVYEGLKSIQEKVGKESISEEDLEGLEPDTEEMARAIMMLQTITSQGASLADVQAEITGAAEYFSKNLDYHLNPDYDPRTEIVGDNAADSYERFYGNNDVKGPDSYHGTHVAGIIAASRNNDIGMNGIAAQVEIMSVRAVPDGDERDKDVANAIIYAVDNGASVINMSFGKSYSWDKKAVEKAIKYAAKNDVLLVHAAGNDSKNNDLEDNFPNDTYESKGLFGSKYAKNWIEVGALSWETGEKLAADFSNYGKEQVDIFAPGVSIYSTTPENNYGNSNGTSMAAPVVAGVAAVIRSYFPDLKATEVKSIILDSAVRINEKVTIPGGNEVIPFSDLSRTGGIVNLYQAVETAMKK